MEFSEDYPSKVRHVWYIVPGIIIPHDSSAAIVQSVEVDPMTCTAWALRARSTRATRGQAVFLFKSRSIVVFLRFFRFVQGNHWLSVRTYCSSVWGYDTVGVVVD